ncbi:hypothetical protein BC939DRAFT_440564 [Gamsiella multidivaricata]|uniref:uncharacterized protein n=1 Tax=Gamsiella multidivaricata TaxID=101098 RepID=UPI00221FE5BE|nr:uncharacterized protein BC939DRAFT_440564 [Gamsiella multidivaricata]KAG0361809.1 hypothetical protein BGZ54_008933 [Gamsiella multidivaricata]KAI7829780.1 hypothetical protein BC939DRAFT_440564 [Gamsiella multidivaricata]
MDPAAATATTAAAPSLPQRSRTPVLPPPITLTSHTATSATATISMPHTENSNSNSSGLFRRHPSIVIKTEKRKGKGKDKDKEKDRDNEGSSKHDGDPYYTKVSLKRSRSPIKLFKNIKTYLHVHKHKYSGNGSHGSSGTSSSSQQLGSSFSGGVYYYNNNNNNSLAPPRSSFDNVSHQYRSASLPSSSILATAQLAQDDSSIPKPPRERQSPDSLTPEKQVLLLQVVSYFEHAGHRADEDTAEYLLGSYQWDIDQTMQYCQDLVQAVQGTLVPVQQEVQLTGAVNDQMTSCYIDALLFAMFARLSVFEGLLNVNLDAECDSDSDGSSETGGDSRKEEEKQEALLHTHLLQTWLRMFVNQLRSGRLIQAHVVKELRQHLYSCGWNCPGPYDPPGSSRQEDSSELFMFLTEKLHLPYLPLEQRLLHGAKFSADDDKVITERMLQISIPIPEPASLSPTSKLESTFSKLLSSKSSSSSSNRDGSGSPGSVYEILSLEKLLAQHFYDNTLTGIRRLVSSGTGVPLSPGVEVPVSAWQVLELLPFYSSSNEQGGIIHASQSQYPADVVILPLILKRYSFGADMQARRINTPIDIPRRIDFSRFVSRQTSGSSKAADPSANNATSDSIANGVSNGNNNDLLTGPQEPSGAASLSSSSSSTLFTAEPGTLSDNISTVGASASVNSLSTMGVNTQAPSRRKYSMSFLQAIDSPSTPITPPPQYSPTVQSKTFLNLGDDKREWSPNPPPDDIFEGDYMDCGQPKIKYMLELKSVVCHLGSRLDSGHYRSYVADTVSNKAAPAPTSVPAPPVSSGSTNTAAATNAAPHPLSFQEPNWLRHDDLDPSGQRVQLITRDSTEEMEMEADWARNGYILFYELQTVPS